MKMTARLLPCAFAFAFALATATAAHADTWTDPATGITWTYTVSNDEASVGGGSSSSTAVPKSTSGSITIPSTLGGYPVTSIDSDAFEACSRITDVIIPDGVTNIGFRAFWYCNNLAGVNIPGGVENVGAQSFCRCSRLTDVTIPDSVTSVGDYAFLGCSKLNVTIGKGVTNIGIKAFSGLGSIKVGEGNDKYSSANGVLLSKDGKVLIQGVNGDVVIPDGVLSIERLAFSECADLTSVMIPNSVTSIVSSAFLGCSRLLSISVDTGNSNFMSVNGLLLSRDGKVLVQGVNGDVVIPDGVLSIGDRAFEQRSGLANITIPCSVTSIGYNAFSGCSALESITIPDSVTSIGGCAFSECGSLASIEIPDGVTRIEQGTFQECSGLTSVKMPDGLISIEFGAFYGCDGLTEVTIPRGVMDIEERAFGSCSGLLSIDVADENLAYISTNGLLLAKDGKTLVQGVNGDVTIPDGVVQIGSYSFEGCSNLTCVEMPDSVTEICDNAFFDCSGLASAVIPDSVTSIGGWAFENCYNLKHMTIPDGVTCIEDYVFFGCSGLTSVTLPAGATSIGYRAFYGCRSLAVITIPDGVTEIEEYAFENCTMLKQAYMPSTLEGRVPDSAFSGCASDIRIIYYEDADLCTVTFDANGGRCDAGKMSMVQGCAIGVMPSADLPEYALVGWFTAAEGGAEVTVDTLVESDMTLYAHWKSAYEWSYQIINGNEVEITGVSPEPTGPLTIPSILDGKPVTYIGKGAFEFCSALTSVTIPDTVTSIGWEAFYACESLNSVAIGIGVTNIDVYAFRGCGGLTNVTIPNNVTHISDGAFLECSGLKSVSIGDGLASIGHTAFSTAFSGCGELVSISVGSGNTHYSSTNGLLLSKDGKILVQGINGDVTIPEGVTDIGNAAFAGCSGLTSVTIPDGVTCIDLATFRDCSGLRSVTIPDSVTNIASVAFSGCRALTSVDIGDGVLSIGDSAFSDCGELSSIHVGSGNNYYSSENGLLLSKDGRLIIRGVNGDVVVPNGVVTIGVAAFSGCSGLTSVIIPDSVRNIEASAFSGCNRLTSVTIPNGVTNIGYRAFGQCGGLTNITIPNSVLKIEDDAFSNCNLVSIDVGAENVNYSSANGLLLSKDGKMLIQGINGEVIIPNGVENIRDGAFWACKELKSVKIPNGVLDIGMQAFSWCEGLNNVTIGNSVTNIGEMAFSGCAALKDIVFWGNAPDVARYTFEYVNSSCTAWVKRNSAGWGVDIPGTWNGIKIAYSDRRITFDANGGEGDMAPLDVALNATTNLTANVFVHDGSEFVGWATSPDGEVVYADGAEITPEDDMTLYAVWRQLPVWTIENGVLTGVELNGFTDIVIPDSVTSIGRYAFRYCRELTSVTIPNSVTNIEDSAFYGCSGLTSLTIPDSVKIIGYNSFGECAKLAVVTMSQSVCLSGLSYVFPDAYETLQTIIISDNVTTIGYEAFGGCSCVTNFLVTDGNPTYSSRNGLLLSKDGSTLCHGINGDVIIPEGVTRIEPYAFYHHHGLTSVTIPSSVTTIDSYAFCGCSGLKSVVIPDGMATLCSGAFYGCTELTNMTISASVVNIGSFAFFGCRKLPSISVAVNNMRYSASDGLLFSDGGKVLVWGKNGDVTIPDGVTSIGQGAFSGCNALTQIVFPEGVTSIGDVAFHGCSGLSNVIIPNSVTRIGERAFYGCSGLASVTIPDGVTRVGDSVFSMCDRLERVTISSSVTNLGNTAFAGCDNLSSVTILGALSSYAQSRFYDATPTSVKTYVTANWTGPTDTWQDRAVEYLTHSISFDSNGGEGEMGDHAVIWYDTTNINPNVFVHDGFEFIGWATSPDGEVVYEDGAEITPEDDMTLYAVWEKLDPVWTIEDGVLTYVELNGNTDIAIPEGVVSVGEYAFGGSEITSVLLPTSLQTIEHQAFQYCMALTNITFSTGLKSIGDCAFEGCYSLSGVFELPEGLTSIGRAFVGGSCQITDLVLPSTLTSLDEQEFLECDSLMNVWFKGNAPEVPDGSSRIDDYKYETSPYYGTRGDLISWVPYGSMGWRDSSTALPDTWPTKTWPDYESRDIRNYGGKPPRGTSGVAPEDAPSNVPMWYVDEYGTVTNVDLNGFTDVTIPAGITGIGDGAFRDRAGLASIVVSDGVASIGEYAFAGCTGLTTVTIPDSVEIVGEHAFDGCFSLKEAFAPESLKWGGIPGSAFSGCAPGFQVSYYEWRYHYINGGTEVEICDEWGLSEPAISPVPAGTMVIPSSIDGRPVTSIGEYAFEDAGYYWDESQNCGRITHVVIPDSVRNIGTCAFSSCTGLVSATIGAGVTNIGNSAFSHCENLAAVTIPDSVQHLDNWAFGHCYALTNVMLSAGVTGIGIAPFGLCRSLTSIDVADGNPVYSSVDGLLMTKDGKTLVQGVNRDLVIPNGVERIEKSAFVFCDALSTMTIPATVTDVGEGAFAGCSGLSEFAVAAGNRYYKAVSGLLLTKDGKTLVAAPGGVDVATIPSGVKTIGQMAFCCCTNLASVAIPNGVTEIGEAAFEECYNLKSVMMPRGVTSIGEMAFYLCKSLVSMTIPDTVTNIGNRAFAGCHALETLRLPVSLKGVVDEKSILGEYQQTEVIYYDPDSILIGVKESYDADADGSFALDLLGLVESDSTPRLTVKGLPAGVKYDARTGLVSGRATKPGVYAVTVSATSATVKKPVTATFSLVVPNLACDALPSLMPETDAYGTISCGVAFDPGLVNCSPEDGWTVKAAGLPTGLKWDAKAGAITGVPTKAGTFTVTFTATRGKEKQTATVTLATEALPDWAAGTFTGYVKENGESTVFGPATMTVAASGKVSGKFTLSGTNWTFAAASYAAVGSEGYIVEAVAKAGKATMPVDLVVLPGGSPETDGNPLVNASAEGGFGGSGDAYVRLWRNMWKDRATSAAAKAVLAGWEGVYTLSVEDGGYASLTVGRNGDVKAAGKLADGTSISATAPFMYHVCKDFFTVLALSPSAYKGGFVYLPVGFGTERGRLYGLGDGLVWSSRNPQATDAYGEGFERWTSFVGAYYDKARKLSDYYEALRFATEAPTLYYTFKETYLGGNNRKTTESYMADAYAADTLGQEGTTVSVNEKGALVVAKATKPVQDRETKEWYYEGANDGALALSFAQATGIFKGSYTFWYDYVSAYDDTKPDGKRETMAHTSKKVSFEGVMVQGEESLRGFYLWDATSSYSDPKTGREKTYKYKESHAVQLAAP